MAHSFQGDGAPFQDRPNNFHIQWAPGPCYGYHQQCFSVRPAGDDELAAIEKTTQTLSVFEVVEFVRSSGGMLSFNAERQAVQVVDCGGNVIAHFPLGHDTVGAQKHFTSSGIADRTSAL